MRNDYAEFAFFYDQLTENVDYPKRAEYILSLLKNSAHNPSLVLDLACGTGKMTVELLKRGIDAFGVDASPDMLSVAFENCLASGFSDILFVCQPMQRLDLFGKVDTVICCLDSINHLCHKRDVMDTFSRVHLFLEKGGFFLFDINTLYKHEVILADNAYLYDIPNVFCAWQNTYLGSGKTKINLTFFEQIDNMYRRSDTTFFERAYPISFYIEALKSCGFQHICIYEEFSFTEPTDTTQRAYILAQKS